MGYRWLVYIKACSDWPIGHERDSAGALGYDPPGERREAVQLRGPGARGSRRPAVHGGAAGEPQALPAARDPL